MARLKSIALLVALAAALWWYRGIATDYRMFGGTLGIVLDVAASLTTAVAAVMVIAEIAIEFWMTTLIGIAPTGFVRAATFAVLGVVALALLLGHFGINVTAILATSAVLTAIVGLSLQSTLGAFISGLTLQADRIVRIGDAIMSDGQPCTLTAIGWHSMTGLKPDGTRVVFSISHVLNGSTDIMPGDSPVQAEVSVFAPLAAEPGRIEAIVRSIVTDLPEVAADRPVTVAPVALDPDKGRTRYRIRYWVDGFAALEPSKDALLARLWHGFQREAIPWPIPTEYREGYEPAVPSLTSPDWTAARALAIRAVSEMPDCQGNSGSSMETMIDVGTLLLYGGGEPIVIPERLMGCHCVLVRGHLREAAAAPVTTLSSTSDLPSRLAVLAEMTRQLAGHIGPFAVLAVQRAADGRAGLRKVRDTIAAEIDDRAARDDFLDAFADVDPESIEPGFSFDLHRCATGVLRPEPPLRADGATAIVAIPAEAARAAGAQG